MPSQTLLLAQAALQNTDLAYREAWTANQEAQRAFMAGEISTEQRLKVRRAFDAALRAWEDAAAAVEAADEGEPDDEAPEDEPQLALALGPCF